MRESAHVSGVGEIVWVDLTVASADEVRDFYAAVVGWRPETLDMGGYEDWVMNAGDRAVAGVCNARGVNVGLPPVWLVYVAVPDLDAALERVTERGGAVVRCTPAAGRLRGHPRSGRSVAGSRAGSLGT